MVKEPDGYEIVQCVVTYSHAMRWDKDGLCVEQINNGPEHRRSDLDFGTPNGDLLIDPWIQDILRDG